MSQNLSRQQIYDRIKASSKDSYILEEMKRLGFWQETSTPSLPEQLIQKEVVLQQELQELLAKDRKYGNQEAMLREMRKNGCRKQKPKEKPLNKKMNRSGRIKLITGRNCRSSKSFILENTFRKDFIKPILTGKSYNSIHSLLLKTYRISAENQASVFRSSDILLSTGAFQKNLTIILLKFQKNLGKKKNFCSEVSIEKFPAMDSGECIK